jgi:hypothetical protein
MKRRDFIFIFLAFLLGKNSFVIFIIVLFYFKEICISTLILLRFCLESAVLARAAAMEPLDAAFGSDQQLGPIPSAGWWVPKKAL